MAACDLRLGLTLLLAAAAPSPASAETYRDPDYGLTLEVPEGYALTRLKTPVNPPGTTLVLTRGEVFCSIDYASGQALTGSQAEVNVRAKPFILAVFRKNGMRDPMTPFVLGDVEGIAAESTFQKTSGQKGREFVVFLETTKGHAHFACADTSEAFDGDKPTFDRLFRSVHLPR